MAEPAQAKPTATTDTGTTTPSLWAMLWPMVRPYRWWVLAGILLNAGSGIATSFQTLLPKYLIDDVLLADGIDLDERYRRVWFLAGLYLFVSIVTRMGFWHLSTRIISRVRERVIFQLRARFFSHVNHLCLRFHTRHDTGELFSYLFGSPLSNVQEYFRMFTMFGPMAMFMLVYTLVWVAVWDLIMSGVLLASLVCSMLVMRIARLRLRQVQYDFQQAERGVSGRVADMLRGSRDVKLYAMEDQADVDFARHADTMRRKAYERDIKGHMQYMKHETVNYVAFAVLFVVGAWRYIHEHITIGELQGYLMAFIAMNGPLGMLFQLATLRGGAQASLERINGVLLTSSTTPDPIGYEAPPPAAGRILFHQVSFAYQPGQPVLRDIDLDIPYGQHVALVGPSGGGKSTLTQLLLRLYDPDQGAILIGGLNLRHCPGQTLRHRFAVVPQDPFIFRTSIRENLHVGNADADDAQLEEAARRANAWEFICALPDGLDTVVGEGGSTLSGGQRQRLAIARALLASADYFIFDEATSALDTHSEALIQEAMERAIAGRTAFIIAHRLATVRHCHRVLVIADGRVVQDGTYDDLVAQPGLFRELVQGQQLRA